MDAFEELVQRYDKRVLTIAAGYVNNADDAKDIFQEVFLRVYRNLHTFENRSEFSTWLFRITTNVCLSHKTRTQKHQHIPLDQMTGNGFSQHAVAENMKSYSSKADQAMHDAEIASRVETALQRLSPRQRMVFTLKHYDGYKLKEIADMMKISEGTVKGYLFEAIGRLRKELKDYAV